MPSDGRKLEDIVQRSLGSVGWNMVASALQVPVGIARSVLLARLLAVEVFGVYGMASSIISLTMVLPGFGMADAFLHRGSATERESHAAAVWLTLKLIFSSVWLVVVGAVAFSFFEGPQRTALVIIGLTHWGLFFTSIPQQILVRRVVHRRLALLQSLDLLLGAPIAVLLAWRGLGLWSLLATDIVTLLLKVFFLYLWRPVWRPRLAWSPTTVRYFLTFGSRNVLAHTIVRALDRMDDLWTGAYLGSDALGFYSRAYAFATYPRTILASSINKVAGGTYAELATDRGQLSKAFFRTNAFLVRSGFYMGGLLVLVAPELIRLLLGPRWLPMLIAFRLMLVFTLLEPIKTTVADLFVAVGRPGDIVKARIAQLAVMIAGLILLGPSLGIAGVALTVDTMLLVGIGILLLYARAHVDFSLWGLFAAPTVALTLGIVMGRGAIMVPGVMSSPWRTGCVKMTVFSGAYAATSLILERRQLLKVVSYLANSVPIRQTR